MPTQLAPAAVATLLRATLAAVQAEVHALNPAQLAWRPSADSWCINEVLGHLIEAEQRGFAGRIRHMLEQEHPQFETWDQPAVARARGDCTRDGHDLLRTFEQLRLTSLQLVEQLRHEQLTRAGYHPIVGELTVHDVLHEWVFHDHDHLQQLFDNVKALLWPHMGSGRKFYKQEE